MAFFGVSFLFWVPCPPNQPHTPDILYAICENSKVFYERTAEPQSPSEDRIKLDGGPSKDLYVTRSDEMPINVVMAGLLSVRDTAHLVSRLRGRVEWTSIVVSPYVL